MNRKFFYIRILIILLFSACVNSSESHSVQSDNNSEYIPVSYNLDEVDVNDRKAVMYALQKTYREVARKVLPGVVEIIKQQIPHNYFSPWNYFGDDWPFSIPEQNNEPLEREYKKQGLGSGVIVSTIGNKHYVVTNNHVIGNADEISIRLHDGREYKAKITGKDSRTDLALAYFKTNDDIPVVNLGNSGGALVNLEGELIGINTWIASLTGGSDGIGFAIPVNNVKKATSDFIDHGEITYGCWPGVSITDISEAGFYDLAEDLKISGKSGALVLNIFKDSPADKSKLLPNDFILEVDNTDIKNSSHLTKVIGNISPGTMKKMTAIRYGDIQEVSVKPDARDDEKKIKENTYLWPGLLVTKPTKEIRGQVKISGNVNWISIL